MKAILAFLFLAAACGAQAATYGELVAARRAGTNIVERPDPARVVARSVLSHTASNALVVAVRLDGTIATNVVHYAMIQGAALVRSNVSARASEAAEWRRMTVALAAAAGSDTNAVLASSAEAMLQRAALYRQAANAAQGGIPWGTAAAAAGGLAAGFLAGRKQSTGATTAQVDPAPGGAGAPTT